MPLPESVDFVAADEDNVPFTTLNSLQDAVVAAQHGSVQLLLPASDGAAEMAGVSVPNALLNNLAHWEYRAAPSVISTPIPVLVGHRIDAIRVWFKDTGDTVSITLQSDDLDGTVTTVAGPRVSGAGGTWTFIDFTSADAGIPAVIGAFPYIIRVVLGGAGVFYVGSRVTYVKP